MEWLVGAMAPLCSNLFHYISFGLDQNLFKFVNLALISNKLV